MYTERHVIPVTTAADGSATAYSPVISGAVAQIHYLKTDFAAGVDFTITSEATGQSLWTEANVNAEKVVAPQQPVHDLAGVAQAGSLSRVYLSADRVKIVIAQGGNAKSGAFHVVLA
jgi:hypothetical protein